MPVGLQQRLSESRRANNVLAGGIEWETLNKWETIIDERERAPERKRAR